MNIIETTAPISIENLQKYFTDKDIKFLIDYENSKLQGSKLLTYLSNIDIPCDIKIDLESDNFYLLLKEYFNSMFIVNIPELENATLKVLFLYKNLITGNISNKMSNFINENLSIIKLWTNILDSLVLYNVYIIEDENLKEHVKSFPKNEESEIVGINFINLLKYEVFYIFYQKINQSNLKYYDRYFNDYIFKGKNLYEYWANENNPLFLMSFAYAEKIIEIKLLNEEKNDSFV